MIEFRDPLSARLVEQAAANWAEVQSDVAAAAEAAGRAPDEVAIVGVTKYVDAPTTACLVAAGCHDLGENRPQVLWQKAAWMEEQGVAADAIRWHMIGHLQRNKARRVLPHVHLLHSVDSLRLANAVSQAAESPAETSDAKQSASLPVLIEVNVTGDEAKTGIAPEAAREVLQATLTLPGLRAVGLMGMAGFEADEKECRRQFAAIRHLRDTWQSEFAIPLPELSMGMSRDFAAAIAEGATLVRIGSRLFEGF